jgi:hypothetical protein
MKLDLRKIPIIYINLDEETDKKQRTEHLLKNLEFETIKRFSAIKHEKGRIVGCARSHYEILNSHKPPFIIIEDDCELNSEFCPIFEDYPNDLDAVYLGISHWGRYLNHSGPYVHTSPVNDKLVRIYNMLSTHAILYWSSTYVEMCAKIAHRYGYVLENHLDIGIAEIQPYFNVYAHDVPIFRQYEWSAITTGKLSENSIKEDESSRFYQSVISDDSNFYKLNSEFKSPFRQLISKRDINGVPGYFVPTRIN